MEKRPFGPTGEEIPVIGQGTWNMEKAPEDSVRALRRGIDLGMTHIDTAEMYGSGRVEEIVGKAIEGRRGEVFLASKVLPGRASYRGTLDACEASLKRLKTDRLDLYLLHWRETGPLEPTFKAFDELQKAGKIRHFGVSNFDREDLEEAEGVVGPGRIACNQVLYHLGERGIEHRVASWCRERRVALVAYSPLGQGRFPPGGEAGERTLAEAAEKAGGTLAQAALRFLTREPHAFAIPKASRLEHVEDNAGAGDLRLSDEALAKIDAAFPRGPKGPLPSL